MPVYLLVERFIRPRGRHVLAAVHVGPELFSVPLDPARIRRMYAAPGGVLVEYDADPRASWVWQWADRVGRRLAGAALPTVTSITFEVYERDVTGLMAGWRIARYEVSPGALRYLGSAKTREPPEGLEDYMRVVREAKPVEAFPGGVAVAEPA